MSVPRGEGRAHQLHFVLALDFNTLDKQTSTLDEQAVAPMTSV